MKITSLNLRQGGGPRIGALSDWLLKTESDVLVCSEFCRNRAGSVLAEALELGGFKGFVSKTRTTREYGVAVFARGDPSPLDLKTADVDVGRIVGCIIGGVSIAGVYFAQKDAKRTLFEFLLSPQNGLGDNHLVIGDFNTGLHYLDEDGATFSCADQFKELTNSGFVDLWRKTNGAKTREFSWVSNRGGQYRIDHAFATKAISDRMSRCQYDHSTRPKLTDHSALSVEFHST
ncbi:endonuclease/exonuclease/phosphatase family protein [Aliiruegeria sabulilitoris]|uniref:endonuclease/exonuclease/phosphatase family protein n=1 Tax=Aliiruegeria sabulilitoris TaxID=1510458 RepID=UPI0009E723E6|nr:endonuclease/exonuclease/phosphatase family protein [Aliiruegeria sabulilitoris]NDR56985.1 hypothetical protein [Pseudoruegeria sp. M32A2M]